MTSRFNPPVDTSTGGAGGGGLGGYSGGNGMVANQTPPRARSFPWPLPYSATQGGVGGAGGKGMVQVSPPPYYGPFLYYWPYAVPVSSIQQTNPVKF
jgi:hypothetical protein